MKIEIDSFSGAKIYPGRGTLFVRGDSKIFRFQSSKSASLFQQRKNPRKISWTVLYRRQHKKGITEETKKRRTKKTVKHQRPIEGASLDFIKEKRNQKPAERKAAGIQAGTNEKVSKMGQKGAFQKVHATSR
ncbi:hypothetical protein METBIDRAFT_220105 [Metschnikowia bicuspidata var. bicuspidata NRRL YB-4993]|uniref:Large ribosomal subunit protein eL24-related N-terminal domain-containing protein n=1 Tax=Metschnikowia bicuspidata var. bicuspidata NRRL YB-4993 TaxID=869754 RepID=A0A1A0H5L2_9ASCO|nr:hypothetical protein METBIDRAFT_220105 [Metschnikowia bicuspidata var. bicuspidata NRRL YB-4993]OBA19203.1 hypothetical protein METBIDRAFT_220105 [Metschnikowia bicuspidata var. bicuspidata NRRL YB-4993]